MNRLAISLGLMTGALALAQEAPAQDPTPAGERPYLVDVGTRIPMQMINSVSTKNAVPGERVYLETTFPIVIENKIVIPAGSYVAGTITETHRPGRVKGKGEFRLRFDSLTLPNGITRDFRATVSGLDGRASETLDRKEGSVRGEGNKSGDAKGVGTATVYGASGGGLIGSAAGGALKGAGIGAAAGAAAGLIGVLMTRGPDAILAKGTTVEMVLDRQVLYHESELNFSGAAPRRASNDGGGPLPSVKSQQKPQGFPRTGP